MSEVDRVESEIVARMLAGASGALQVRDGKKRWVFAFDRGALVATHSNLKSEQDSAILSREPDLDRPSMLRKQAVRRLWNACRSKEASWSFEPDVTISGDMEYPLPQMLCEALAECRTEAELEMAVKPLLRGHPIAGEPTRTQPLDEPFASYLLGLDGMRSGVDAVAFAPGSRSFALAALWVAWKFGWIGPGPSEPIQAEAARPVTEELDILSLINEEISQGPTSPPPRAGSRADTRGVPPNSLPPPSGTRSVPLRASDPLSVSPSGEPDHPLLPRIIEIQARIEQSNNIFEWFDLGPEAPVESFRKAFNLLARDLHPDRYADAPPELLDHATALFAQVRDALDIISDETERRKYTDKHVYGRKTEDELAMEQVQAYWTAEADFRRGVAAFNAGRLREAHKLFSAAVEMFPDELEFRAYHSYTSFTQAYSRSPNGAGRWLEDLKQVLEQNAQQTRKLDAGWVLLGRAHATAGDHVEARKAFIKAMRLNPSNADAQLQLRRLESLSTRDEGKKGFFSSLFKKR